MLGCGSHSGGLFGAASQAFSEFRRAVDQGRASGDYDTASANGKVPGSFVVGLIRGMPEVLAQVDGENRSMSGDELARLIDAEDVFHLRVIEF